MVKLHGFPRTIVLDRDNVFVSSLWQHLTRLNGAKLHLSSSYHPQTDGQSEVLNKCLEMYLRCFVFDCPKKWLDFLPWLEFSYNIAFHTAINMSPFKAVYGREPPTLLPTTISNDLPADLYQQLPK